jgi:uncharacterized protein (DUF305 family)
MRKTAVILAVASLSAMTVIAFAQMQQHGPGGHSMPGGMMHDAMTNMQPKGDIGLSSQAYNAANRKMHVGMDITYTGNADVDFVKGMIPHHAGAVDMAKVVLSFGKDPEIRKLAEAIIKAQETEIAQMQEWLKKNAK